MRNAALALSLASLLLLAGCASTSSKLIESYRAPGTMSFVFEKAAVAALNGGPETRAAAEDAIIAEAKGKRLVAAHNVLPNADMRSAETVRRKLLEQNIDGLLTMRIVRATEINAGEMRPGESFSSYAQSVPPGEPPFGAGKMRVEANIFRLEDGALIWHGIVECDQPNDLNTLIHDAVVPIARHLRDTGLVHD